jgi:hypothetical protein
MGSKVQKPLLGGSPEQREAFREYTVCFSTQDFVNIRKFFTDDIRLELADVATLDGPEAFIEFYRNQAKSVREILTINHMVADEGGIVADITATFTGVAEKPIPGSMWQLEKGQSVAGRFFVYYLLRDGKMYSIRVATVSSIEPVP